MNAVVKERNSYKTYTEKQILEAFRAFDKDRTGSIRIKDVVKVVRILGRIPRKKELKDFLNQVRDKNDEECAKLKVLLPALRDILINDMWKPASKDVLLQAFQLFDRKRTGSLGCSFISELMSGHGDPLGTEEVNAFLSFAVDPFTGTIPYARYCERLEASHSWDIVEEKRKIQGEVYKKKSAQ